MPCFSAHSPSAFSNDHGRTNSHRVARNDGVSGAELSQQLGVSRAAIWARIEELRRLGYDIEAGPHLGYRLVSAPDVLHADDLLARLGKTKVIGRDIRVFEQTTSTNDVIEKLARDGVKEGVGGFCRIADQGPGPARAQMDFARPQRALVFRFAAAGFASAGSDATDRGLRHGPAPRDSVRDRLAAGNQMAERHFDWREKGRGHSDRVERGTGPRASTSSWASAWT